MLKTADIRLEGNYGVLNFLEVGIYMGYARYKSSFFNLEDYEPDSNGIYSNIIPIDGHFLSYGINANLHIFPFFIKKPDFRFDLYVTAKYGGRSSLVVKDKADKHNHDLELVWALPFIFLNTLGYLASIPLGDII